jgi:multicomponent K+:H+ antiporter subunit E
MSPPGAAPSDPPAVVEMPARARPGLFRRLVPRPWAVLWLWAAWLLLNQTVANGHLALGLALALVLARLPAAAEEPPGAGRRGGALRHPIVATRLALVVTWDIVAANLQVASRILGPSDRLHPRFVWVPLDVRRPRSITLLAGIITMTPGTLSAELSDDRRHLLVHGLDVDDPVALVADIKARYETPIKELFE